MHYWWLLLLTCCAPFACGFILGFLAGMTIVKKGTAAAIKNANNLRSERDRLLERLHYVGQRKVDG
jgi:hypothetical protein